MELIKKDKLIYTMDQANTPALKIEPGTDVAFETCDCFGESIKTEKDLILNVDFTTVNPATGPVYVNGAKPGDILKVKINKIEVEDQGAITIAGGFGLLGYHIDSSLTRIVSVKGDKVYYLGKEIPMRKMIGVIGTAPADGAIETGFAGSHGGNLDCLLITEGATLYLPVNVEGALFALGDLHAAMGEGEIGISGAEISGYVETTIDLVKDEFFPVPLVADETRIATIWSAPTMEEAAKEATLKMVYYLEAYTKMSFGEAIMFLSVAGDLIPCQVVGENMTFRMEVDRKVIEQYQ